MASVFDIFTNNAAQQAAQDQIAGLNQGYNLASGDLNSAIQYLQQQFGNAQGQLTPNYANAAWAIQNAGNTANNAINTGTNNATGALTSNYSAALQPFLQNYGTANAGQTWLANALGLNGGPAGASAAANAYASNPAYQFDLNQGNQNVLRNAAQTGTLASGGTLNALQTQGQGLANNTYQQYVQNLMPFLAQATSGAAGIGSTLTGLGSGLAGLYTGQGTNLANVATGTGSNLANLWSGYGNASANLSTALGTNVANEYGNLANLGWQYGTGTGNANANAALADNTASGNIFNALGGLLSLGTGGGATLGGQLLSKLIPSDERLKEDIERVGELNDGTGVYRYRYIWDDPRMTRLGLMAQEVEQTKPDAVKEIGGFKAVDYGKATEDAVNDNTYASKLKGFLEAA